MSFYMMAAFEKSYKPPFFVFFIRKPRLKRKAAAWGGCRHACHDRRLCVCAVPLVKKSAVIFTGNYALEYGFTDYIKGIHKIRGGCGSPGYKIHFAEVKKYVNAPRRVLCRGAFFLWEKYFIKQKPVFMRVCVLPEKYFQIFFAQPCQNRIFKRSNNREGKTAKPIPRARSPPPSLSVHSTGRRESERLTE